MQTTVTIKSISAYQIYDSRGLPTIEAELITSQDSTICDDHVTAVESFRAAVPSGASTGKHEAVELRDNDPSAFHGKGVSKAIRSVNEIIAPALVGKDVASQSDVDMIMCKLDGTKNKGNLGANAILSVSLAFARAIADLNNVPLCQFINTQLSTPRKMTLPTPYFNVINGGSHAGNILGFQEFMIVPTSATSFKEAMKVGSEVYQTLKSVLKEKFGLGAVNVGDEGGFAPQARTPEDALDLIMLAIKKSNYEGKVSIALDVAASEFMGDHKQYSMHYKNKENKEPALSGKALADYYLSLVDKYPIISIEDPFDQDDMESWSYLRAKVGEYLTSKKNRPAIQIVGDDLTVTNVERIRAAQAAEACDCLLLKVNQIGTLTEAIESACLAFSYGWNVMVSHRSGETEDSFIADLVVGLGSNQIKSGAPCRSERLAKYNQLLRLEAALF